MPVEGNYLESNLDAKPGNQIVYAGDNNINFLPILINRGAELN